MYPKTLTLQGRDHTAVSPGPGRAAPALHVSLCDEYMNRVRPLGSESCCEEPALKLGLGISKGVLGRQGKLKELVLGWLTRIYDLVLSRDRKVVTAKPASVLFSNGSC